MKFLSFFFSWNHLLRDVKHLSHQYFKMSFFQNSSIFLYFYLWNQIWNLDFTRYLSCFTKTFLKTFQCWQCKSGKIGKKLVCGNKRFCCIYSRCHNNSSYICYFAISYWERFKHCKLQQKFIQNTIFFFFVFVVVLIPDLAKLACEQRFF